MTGVHTAKKILESLLTDLQKHEEAIRTIRAGIEDVVRLYPELRNFKPDDLRPNDLCIECD